MSRDCPSAERIDWLRSTPFFALHAACALVLWTGWSPAALVVCALLYLVRMFGITGGYHRYFSHRTYQTSRWFQFVLAVLGASATQKGPLWWASHHRRHHANSDTDDDVHSPRRGFWWSHTGWFLCSKYHSTDFALIPDLVRFPELLWLNRAYVVPPVLLACLTALLGAWLGRHFPSWHTGAGQMLVWGYVVSTVLLYHGTFAINSLAHVIGRARFMTGDDSRNSLLLALITLGEGWHNNHHYSPSSERQGFFWWELDISHGVLSLLSWMGLVWNLRAPPAHVYDRSRPEARVREQAR